MLRIDRLDALHIAAGEFADQRDVHAADEADLLGLRRHRGEHADEVGALLLLEHDRADVRLVDDHVDDGELVSGNSAATFSIAAAHREAGADDRVVAVLGELAQRLLALGVVLDLEIAIFDAGLRLELLGAIDRRPR